MKLLKSFKMLKKCKILFLPLGAAGLEMGVPGPRTGAGEPIGPKARLEGG